MVASFFSLLSVSILFFFKLEQVFYLSEIQSYLLYAGIVVTVYLASYYIVKKVLRSSGSRVKRQVHLSSKTLEFDESRELLTKIMQLPVSNMRVLATLMHYVEINCYNPSRFQANLIEEGYSKKGSSRSKVTLESDMDTIKFSQRANEAGGYYIEGLNWIPKNNYASKQALTLVEKGKIKISKSRLPVS